MLEPSIDKLLSQVDSKYSLVILEAKRAHELRDGERPTKEFKAVKRTLQALEEIADGTVSIHPAPDAKRETLLEKREMERLEERMKEKKIKEQIEQEEAEEEAKQKGSRAAKAAKNKAAEAAEAENLDDDQLDAISEPELAQVAETAEYVAEKPADGGVNEE